SNADRLRILTGPPSSAPPARGGGAFHRPPGHISRKDHHDPLLRRRRRASRCRARPPRLHPLPHLPLPRRRVRPGAPHRPAGRAVAGVAVLHAAGRRHLGPEVHLPEGTLNMSDATRNYVVVVVHPVHPTIVRVIGPMSEWEADALASRLDFNT